MFCIFDEKAYVHAVDKMPFGECDDTMIEFVDEDVLVNNWMEDYRAEEVMTMDMGEPLPEEDVYRGGDRIGELLNEALELETERRLRGADVSRLVLGDALVDSKYARTSLVPNNVDSSCMGPTVGFQERTRSAALPGEELMLGSTPPHGFHRAESEGVGSPDISSVELRMAFSENGSAQDALDTIAASMNRTRLLGGKKKTMKEAGTRKISSKARVYSNPTASNFCHTCWRRAKYTPMATCSNIHHNKCRKVICKKCFVQFNWDWKAATAEGSDFKCTHCLNSCPEGSQCFTYGKTHLKRKSLRQVHPPPLTEENGEL